MPNAPSRTFSAPVRRGCFHVPATSRSSARAPLAPVMALESDSSSSTPCCRCARGPTAARAGAGPPARREVERQRGFGVQRGNAESHVLERGRQRRLRAYRPLLCTCSRCSRPYRASRSPPTKRNSGRSRVPRMCRRGTCLAAERHRRLHDLHRRRPVESPPRGWRSRAARSGIRPATVSLPPRAPDMASESRTKPPRST